MTVRLLTFAVLAAAVLPAGHAQEKAAPPERKAAPDRRPKADGRQNPFTDRPAQDAKQDPSSPSGVTGALAAGGPGAGAGGDLGTGRAVTVEVLLADVRFKKDGPAADLSGPDALDGLAKAGHAVETQRLTVTSLDGGPVAVKAGASRPIVEATTVAGGRGLAQQSVNYRDTGTSVAYTARVAADGSVTLELSVEGSGVRAPDAASGGATGAAAGAVGAATFETLRFSARLRCPDGRPVVAHASRSDGPAGRSAAMVVVTARVVKDK